MLPGVLVLLLVGAGGLQSSRKRAVDTANKNRLLAVQVAEQAVWETTLALREDVVSLDELPPLKSTHPGFTPRLVVDSPAQDETAASGYCRPISVEVGWPGGTMTVRGTLRSPSRGSWFSGEWEEEVTE